MRDSLTRIGAAWLRGWRAARGRVPALDHAWRARERYASVSAGRLAAATAYYGFFSVFAMVVACFAVLGQVFSDNTDVLDVITEYLGRNLPQLRTEELIGSSGRLGVIALVALVIAGVSWVENLRASQRAIWRLNQQPGNPVVRWLVDLAVLVGIGLLLMISVAVFTGLQDLLLRLSGETDRSAIRAVLRGSGFLQSGLIDLVLGASLLVVVPRLRMSMWRLLPSAALFAVGFGLLKTLGKWYITRVEHNPAYQVAAGTVGLLLFMYLLHQVLLYAAALAATSNRGSAREFTRHRRTTSDAPLDCPGGDDRAPKPSCGPGPTSGPESVAGAGPAPGPGRRAHEPASEPGRRAPKPVG